LFNKQNREATLWPYPPREISDLAEVTHVLLRYLFKEVPPQSNCPQDDFIFRSWKYFLKGLLKRFDPAASSPLTENQRQKPRQISPAKKAKSQWDYKHRAPCAPGTKPEKMQKSTSPIKKLVNQLHR